MLEDSTSGFLAAFGTTGVAEIGDKSFFTVLILSTRYKPLSVLAGTAAAFVILNALAVGVGCAAAKAIPGEVVTALSGLVFLIFGVLLWRQTDDTAPQQVESSAMGAFIGTFVAIGMAELGDRTQIAVASLAAKYQAPLEVFAGGTAAILLVSAGAALAGTQLKDRLPFPLLRRVSAIVFVAFGAVAFIELGVRLAD